MQEYPVHAARRSNEFDDPKPEKVWETIGIFTERGYWFSSGDYTGTLEFPLDHQVMADRVAQAINLAYRKGREDEKREMQKSFRELLGISDPVDEPD